MLKQLLKFTRKSNIKALRHNAKALLLYTAYSVSVNKAGAKPKVPEVVFKPCAPSTPIFNTDRQTAKIIYMKVPLRQHFYMLNL